MLQAFCSRFAQANGIEPNTTHLQHKFWLFALAQLTRLGYYSTRN